MTDSVLDLPMGEGTIRDFFRECMVKLWEEGECFSGKRPLGGSGWEGSILEAVMRAGLAKNDREAGRLIYLALKDMK